MPVLAEKELDKLATEVVDQYIAGTARLDEAAAKQASEHGLNPDQIERMTQSANTMTFLRLMDQRKQAAATDMMHEFEPIDARHVIKIVIDKAGVHVDTPGDGDECKCDDSDELPDDMGKLRKGPSEPAEKAASASDDEEELTPRQKDNLQGRMRKLAGVMQDEILQAGYIFEEKFDGLIDTFNRRPEKFAAFEKDASIEHGDKIGTSLVTLIRSRLRLPVRTEKLSFDKTADFHISDDTPEMATFESLVELVSHVEKLAQGIERINGQCAR